MNEVTLKELVDYVLQNRRGKAFQGYSEHDIAASLFRGADECTMFYACNHENKVCGVVLATKDEALGTFFVNEILTTEPWVFKEFVRILKTKFSHLKLQAQRWKGKKKENPKFVNYNNQRLISLVMKGT